MTREAVATLFHPFEAGVLDAPGKGARVLFLGAEPGFRLPDGFEAELACVQGFRPDFVALEKNGFRVTPVTEGDGYDAALVLTGRHRGQNEGRLAEALERTKAGALLLVAGSKDDGIASLRKRVETLMPVEGSLPKYHGIAFWLRRPLDVANAISALRESAAAGIVEGRFSAAPGMFSHDRVDAGSRLLAKHLPKHAKGAAADFCAGWGYLAAELAEMNPGLSSLDAIEADLASLKAAESNLAASPLATRFLWLDLLAEKPDRRYDLIVMNPPFHQGRAAEPDIGQGMIRAAAAALKPGGRLFMVANRPLPYERVLQAAFSRVEEVVRDGGFKVLSARR